jgi:hypothetical protein
LAGRHAARAIEIRVAAPLGNALAVVRLGRSVRAQQAAFGALLNAQHRPALHHELDRAPGSEPSALVPTKLG